MIDSGSLKILLDLALAPLTAVVQSNTVHCGQ
jgi:hypothetical protein